MVSYNQEREKKMEKFGAKYLTVFQYHFMTAMAVFSPTALYFIIK